MYNHRIVVISKQRQETVSCPKYPHLIKGPQSHKLSGHRPLILRVKEIIIIVIYLSCSWVTCWPVPFSLTHSSLQRSTVIPSANWGVGCHYLLTYLLTYSMVQNPSWVANWLELVKKFPAISRNPKVHYRTQKGPPTVSILGHPNLVHIMTSHPLEIHPNIIHLSMPRFPHWSLSLRLPWVIYFEAFYLHVVSSFYCIPEICPKLVLFLTHL